eukprot:CAMPEP_0202486084 /NCGR_PEP_ID=MMETSP1361-20130828/4741_1 /ASSEMBLY_ACC=CAM_ASM_000849 /TAXON_ID=210615 /ORGANISM="Staurosira complex sp., Strain CCMP2646" /LENGTH=51 /DNA_ID=CAMNT_0049115123 /DNA_START=88 /DNA_END=239 /DNA_ORIENTATION=-
MLDPMDDQRVLVSEVFLNQGEMKLLVSFCAYSKECYLEAANHSYLNRQELS